jgi:hypothetical protein
MRLHSGSLPGYQGSLQAQYSVEGISHKVGENKKTSISKIPKHFFSYQNVEGGNRIIGRKKLILARIIAVHTY